MIKWSTKKILRFLESDVLRENVFIYMLCDEDMYRKHTLEAGSRVVVTCCGRGLASPCWAALLADNISAH